jgi:hypothetical protein
MEGSDILQTLAEVAIALTGFTGIVVALRGRAGESLSGFAFVRFRILLVASLAAVAFALLPFLLHHAGLPSNALWSTCSGVVAVFMVPIAVHDIRANREYADVMPAIDRQIVPLLGLLGSALALAQIANVFVLHAFAPYLAAPMWFVGFSAFQFCRLLLSAEETAGP